MFDHPRWKRNPIGTAWRLVTCKLRQTFPGFSTATVAYAGSSRMVVDVRTAFGYTVYRYGHPDPDIELVSRLLAPGDVFVDGGAHVGLFTLVAASMVGPTGRVMAYEPAPNTREHLERNLRANGYSWVDVSGKALSDTVGERTFTAFGESSWGSSSFAPPTDISGGEAFRLETTTLDKEISVESGAKVALIKLDLEGAEMAALRGAERLIADLQPAFLLELEPDHLARQGASLEELCKFLQERDYLFFQTENGSLVASDPLARGNRSPNHFAIADFTRFVSAGIRIEGKD